MESKTWIVTYTTLHNNEFDKPATSVYGVYRNEKDAIVAAVLCESFCNYIEAVVSIHPITVDISSLDNRAN